MNPLAPTPDLPSYDPERRPRPEARSLRWEELQPTLREALWGLIHWLQAAVDSSGESKSTSMAEARREQLATSVLIAGDRGFGKTTLLLTLADALQRPDHFLASPQGRRAGTDARPCEPMTRGVETHPLCGPLEQLGSRMVLLNPLDMEPLPVEANLLATLLVRVRDALSLAPFARERERLSSPVLMEEGVDEPWGKIDQLVRDATFMWEDIPARGQDRRQLAEYQLRAAELYATFPKRFHDAIESVCRHLSRRRFGYESEDGVVLVLPIDNVDRSIQHLHLILKLTRLVASRRLWFLLASGRQEFQLFLERTFQKELTEAGRVMVGPDILDQTRAIARRQAAAAMRRVLPEAHRIEIRPLRPEEAWEFRAPMSMSGEQEDMEPLHALLERIPLPCKKAEGVDSFLDWKQLEPEEQRRRSFAALFDLRIWAPTLSTRPERPAREGPLLTEAARLALTLSARTALDFWQAARTASQAGPATCSSTSHELDEPAIDIARRMLLASIDESDLPGWASEQLLHRIIRRDREKQTVLDFTGTPILRQKRTVLSDVLESPLADGREPEEPGAAGALRTAVHLRHLQNVLLVLRDLDDPQRTVLLPPSVCGWLMLLHDLLSLPEEPRIWNIRVTPTDLAIELVVTQHEVELQPLGRDGGARPPHLLAELNVWWTPPEWETFIDFALFNYQWVDGFVARMQELGWMDTGQSVGPRFRDCRLRLLLAAWADNVCAVSAGRRQGWSPRLPTLPEGFSPDLGPGLQEELRRHEARVRATEAAVGRLENVAGDVGEELGERGRAFEQRLADLKRKLEESRWTLQALLAPYEDALRELEARVAAYEETVARNVEQLYLDSLKRQLPHGTSLITWRWLMFSLPLMLEPEFLPRTITRHLRERITARHLPLPWNASLLEQRRFEVVRAVMQRTEAYGRYAALLGAPGELLLEACQRWHQRVDTPAPEAPTPDAEPSSSPVVH